MARPANRPTRPGVPRSRRRRVPAALAWRLGLTRGNLVLERMGTSLWPLAGVLGLFLTIALLDLLPALPGWLHLALLIGFAAGLLAALWYAVKTWTWPSETEAGRRLEQDSGVDHRPLTAFNDKLASDERDSAAVALWQEHRRRLRAKLAQMRVHGPRPVMARLDPFAVRALLGLLLIFGVAVGHDDWSGRLSAAVVPQLKLTPASSPVTLDVWMNPPAYTDLPPQFLDVQTAATEPLAVPIGSTLLAQVQGGRGVPALLIDEQSQAFDAVTQDAYRASAVIQAGQGLTIQQGTETLAHWDITVLPDKAPSIEFLSPPGPTERAVLKLDYRAADDYGLASITAEIARIDSPEQAPLVIELPLPSADLRTADNKSYHDLTPHPWAGLAVEIRLVATDAIDQVGSSEPVRTVLPERIFNHPVARALVELRKQLTVDPNARFPVIRALSEIYKRPEHFFHDTVVALAIRAAERRLIHNRGEDAIPQVQQLMWDTALRIEEGDLAIAERELREIQEALMRALSEGASDEKIEELIEQLREALDRYLEALAEQMQDRLAEGQQPQPLPPEAQLLERRDLQELIDQARELAKSGARDAARELLAQLQDMLENLRSDPFAQLQDGQNSWEMLRDMHDMMDQQQNLLDRSYQRSQEGSQGGEGQDQQSTENSRDGLSQESLRRELGEMMRRLGEAFGEIPRPFGRAERAMRDARDALGRDQPGEAIDPQTRALDQLQQGMEAMAERIMEQFGNTPGRGQGTVGMEPGQGRDPLGRETGNAGLEAVEGVEIPEKMELRRAREILHELRRRRGEEHRPPGELDYIDRLLQQF